MPHDSTVLPIPGNRQRKLDSGLRGPLAEMDTPGMDIQSRMTHYKVPHVSIAIINNGTIETATYHQHDSPEIATDTMFQAGSISKAITAVLALKLVENGVLKLDEDVNLTLKNWQVPYVDAYNQNADQKVTLRRLLSHTAGLSVHGFPGYPSSIDGNKIPTNLQILNGGIILLSLPTLPPDTEMHHFNCQYIYATESEKLFYVNPTGHLIEQPIEASIKPKFVTCLERNKIPEAEALVLTPEQMAEMRATGSYTMTSAPIVHNAPVVPNAVPGIESCYSGGGTQIVQQLIEDVTGRSFAEIAKETIFMPLGMHSSTFALIAPESKEAKDIAIGHKADGNPIPGGWNMLPESAAAGLWSTPKDIAKFVMAVQNHKILNPDTTHEMLSLQKPSTEFGLGMHVHPSVGEFSHTGLTDGFQNEFVGFTKTGQGIVIMTNSANGLALIPEIKRSVAKVYEWPEGYQGQCKEVCAIAISPDLYKPCVGSYIQILPNGQQVNLSLSVDEANRFFIHIPWPNPDSPPIKLELHASSDCTFFTREKDLEITLHPEKNNFELFGIAAKKIDDKALIERKEDSSHITKELREQLQKEKTTSQAAAAKPKTEGDLTEHNEGRDLNI